MKKYVFAVAGILAGLMLAGPVHAAICNVAASQPNAVFSKSSDVEGWEGCVGAAYYIGDAYCNGLREGNPGPNPVNLKMMFFPEGSDASTPGASVMCGAAQWWSGNACENNQWVEPDCQCPFGSGYPYCAANYDSNGCIANYSCDLSACDPTGSYTSHVWEFGCADVPERSE